MGFIFAQFHEVSPHPYEAIGEPRMSNRLDRYLLGKGLMFSETKTTPCFLAKIGGLFQRQDLFLSGAEETLGRFAKMTQNPLVPGNVVWHRWLHRFGWVLYFPTQRENFNQEYVANPHLNQYTPENERRKEPKCITQLEKTQHPTKPPFFGVPVVDLPGGCNAAGQKRAPLGFETGELRASDWGRSTRYTLLKTNISPKKRQFLSRWWFAFSPQVGYVSLPRG